MKKHILYNGQLVDSDVPILSGNSRSYRYGDGFFESMRLIDGRLHFASRHLARIEKSILNADGEPAKIEAIEVD